MLDAREFQTLFEASPGQLLVLTPELVIVAVSNAYLRATLTNREQILGKNIFDVFPDNLGDPASSGFDNLHRSLERVITLREADTMAVQRYDIPCPSGDFEVRYWTPVNHPVFDDDGHLRYVIHRVEDVTEYVHLEAQRAAEGRRNRDLQSKTSQMEADILQRSRDLDAVNQELRRALRFRDEFLSIVSHELRTPLTSLSLKLHLLKKHCLQGDLSSDRATQNITDSLKQTERLNRLIHDLLDVSRMMAEPLALEPTHTDLVELVSQSVAQIREVAGQAQSSIHFHAETPVLGVWDPNRLEQVVDNLLSNAVKYGSGNPIEVIVGTWGGNAWLSVRDRGIGIAPDKLDGIFDRFSRAVPQNYYAGIGLGLYIVKQIVDRHGGTIHVDSTVGKGTTVNIYLPHYAKVAREVQDEQAAEPSVSDAGTDGDTPMSHRP